MVSFEGLLLGPGVPIYLQIIQYIKREIVAGTVRDGDEMPSRRVLSAYLGVNPNTIQKAYRLLEEEGLICSHSGAKSYVTLTAEQLRAIRRQLLETDAKALVEAMKQMGVGRTEALTLIEQLWEVEDV